MSWGLTPELSQHGHRAQPIVGLGRMRRDKKHIYRLLTLMLVNSPEL